MKVLLGMEIFANTLSIGIHMLNRSVTEISLYTRIFISLKSCQNSNQNCIVITLYIARNASCHESMSLSFSSSAVMRDTIVYAICGRQAYQYFEAGTKWLPCGRKHLEIYCLGWYELCCICFSITLKFVSNCLVKNK